jgi:hypothetical protein
MSITLKLAFGHLFRARLIISGDKSMPSTPKPLPTR